MKSKKTNVLSNELEVEKVKPLINQIENNAVLIDEIVNKLVNDYSEQLNNYLKDFKVILSDENNPITDVELDDVCLYLPTLLYFTAQGNETLGIREDISKAIMLEVYNKAFELAEGTIADKSATAQLASQNETIINIAYNRAYKQIKSRLENGNEILQSVKKVITRRTEEIKLSGMDRGVINGTVR